MASRHQDVKRDSEERRDRAMGQSIRIRKAVFSAAAIIAVVVGLSRYASNHAVRCVVPYQSSEDTWVFDDPNAGLVREPFVKGIPKMIGHLVAGIPKAEEGFSLYFSASPFPGYQEKITWVRESAGGNYYHLEYPPIEGWLCPALFKFFPRAPRHIYIKAEQK